MNAEQMPPLPAYIYGRECAANERVWTDVAVHAYARLYAAQEVAKEREACALVCESLFDSDDDTCDEAEKCAAAIRARGAA